VQTLELLQLHEVNLTLWSKLGSVCGGQKAEASPISTNACGVPGFLAGADLVTEQALFARSNRKVEIRSLCASESRKKFWQEYVSKASLLHTRQAK